MRLIARSAAILVALSASAMADDYLKALESEIEGLDSVSGAGQGVVEGAAGGPESGAAAPIQRSRDDAGLLLDMGGFENRLLREYPGSYLLYMKLGDKAKRSVYEDYRSTGDFSTAREKVIHLNTR